MRALLAVLILLPCAALAQPYGQPPGAPPAAPSPIAPAPNYPVYPPGGPSPGAGQQGYGGCFGCSYTGEYYGSNASVRRPAPPLRLQGQWRNGWWYY